MIVSRGLRHLYLIVSRIRMRLFIAHRASGVSRTYSLSPLKSMHGTTFIVIALFSHNSCCVKRVMFKIYREVYSKKNFIQGKVCWILYWCGIPLKIKFPYWRYKTRVTKVVKCFSVGWNWVWNDKLFERVQYCALTSYPTQSTISGFCILEESKRSTT